MLQSLLAYARGAGVDVRWATIGGDQDFFRITKRIHNHLHGLGGRRRRARGGASARSTTGPLEAATVDAIVPLVGAGDVVYLHDPQTAGWSIGHAQDRRAGGLALSRRARSTQRSRPRRMGVPRAPTSEDADAYVFSRRALPWEGLEEDKLWLVAPSIDAFSPKNQDLDASGARDPRRAGISRGRR